ncbi:class I SAM-dependent methyltransferase, partial [Burkholderia sp. SIMBA_013]
MQYSSGLFKEPADSLEQAQRNKMQRLCDSLDLKAQDHLLEIGTGWGGLAIYAAKNYGCRVTTTTISDEQFQYAKQQVEAAG